MDFRAVLCTANVTDNGVLMPEDAYQALSLKPGENIAYWSADTPLRNTRRSPVKAHI